MVFQQIKIVISKIHKETNKSKLLLFLDILICMMCYGASPNNYWYFQFYKIPRKYRKTYTTNKISQKMIKKYNNPVDIDIFENKLIFAEKFSDMYCRSFLSAESMTKQDFELFCTNKEKFILKPCGGAQGQNIKVYHINNNVDFLFDEIKENYCNGYIIEEWIVQHPILSKIFPDAVNCLRVITVLNNDKVEIITGGVTFSLGAEIANGSQPSIVAPVDFSTGIINKPAASFGTYLYEKHPTTNAQILGVQLPYWKEILALLEKAAKHVPSVGYIGWDIAITPTGPVLIEGNTTPGYKYYQIPAHLFDKKGNKDKYTCHL